MTLSQSPDPETLFTRWAGRCAVNNSPEFVIAALMLTLVTTPVAASKLFSRPGLQSHYASALGDWRLRIDWNRFSGEIQCRLRSRDGGIRYSTSALGFRFPKHLDTSLATYRINDEPVQQWRDALPELVRLGAPIDGPDLDHPTGGIVWIPAAQLRDANSITIQPKADRRPQTFRLRGFAELLDIARARGCMPDNRFVP